MIINRDAWLQAVREVEETRFDIANDPNVLTLAEFAKLIGKHRHTAGRRLQQLVASGKAVRESKKFRRSDDVVVTVPAYRLLVPDPTPKAKR